MAKNQKFISDIFKVKSIPKLFWTSTKTYTLRPNPISFVMLVIGLAMFGLGEAFLIAAGLLALAKFLRSGTWKQIRKLIEGNPLVGVLGAVTALVAVLFPLRTISAITKVFKGGGVLLTKFLVFSKDIFGPFRKNGKIGRAFRKLRVFFKKTIPTKGCTTFT